MLKKKRVLELAVVIAVLLLLTMPASAPKILTACEESDLTRVCTHQEMMVYLAQINANSQEMLLSSFGKSVKGHELVYAVFSRPMVTNPFEAMSSGKPIVILDAGVHGDERTLRESNVILIRELAEQGTEMNALLDDLVVIMIPCLNPDGTEHDKRRNANNSDINRDYIKLDEPETESYVSNVLHKWHPHVQIGGHNGGVYPYNICYLAPTNAAADSALYKFCDEGIFRLIDKNMEAAGFKSFYHGRGNQERWEAKSPSPKIFRNYGGISNYISIVFESPTRQGMENGIKSGIVAYKSILEYCAETPGKVMEVVEQVRKNTIKLGQKAQGQIPVQMKYVPEDYKVSYLISEEVEVPGDEGEEPATKRILTQITNADLLKKPVATKTRPRPYAYILPADARKAIDLLKRHNITVEVLQQDISMAVKAYVLEDIRHEKEDNHPEATFVTIADATVKKVMNFPKGTYVVRTGQVMGRIISHMLEPETPENIIIWNTIDDLLPPPGPNSFIPIYKLPRPTNLPIALGVGGNDAKFVAQKVSTSMKQGGKQQASITLKNTGTETWSISNGQSLGNQNPQRNTTWTRSTRVALPHDVSPNQEVTFTFTITAPLVNEFINFQWQMVDDSGLSTGRFGEPTSKTSIAVGTPTNMVKLYRDRGYGGWEAIFGVGEFTTADLLAAGGLDNDVDSVRVAPGYRVEFYEEDNFGGTPEIHTVDNPDTDWHNEVSSLKVMAVSTRIDGALVIGGGGGLPDSVYEEFIKLAGSADSHIVVIPTASSRADDGDSSDAIESWKQRGSATVTVLHTRDRDVANKDEFIAPLKKATGVWFGGGSQSRITDAYLGTAVERELWLLLKRGGVIGGSSAGAAIMTEVMIAGGNPKARTAKGFGFLPGAVADQHFLRRNRVNRLIGVLQDHPGLVGFGIDEGMAIVVTGSRVRAVGRSYVTVLVAGAPQRPLYAEMLEDGEEVDLTELSTKAARRINPTAADKTEGGVQNRPSSP